MTIAVKEIIEYFDHYAPGYLAEDWDNVGLLLGSRTSPVKKILVSLDITKEVVQEAIEKNVDLIISHHPLIFKGLKAINSEQPKGKVLFDLIQNNISVYCAHTNLDVAEQGINQLLGETIGLGDIQNLNEYKIEAKTGKVYGLGKYGVLIEPMDFEGFLTKIKNDLQIQHLRVVGTPKREIQTVAVFCGSFDEDYSGILKSKADILITGDLKYHAALDMKEMGICVIDAGHFYTERIVVPDLVTKLKKAFPEIELIGSTVEKDPFEFT